MSKIIQQDLLNCVQKCKIVHFGEYSKMKLLDETGQVKASWSYRSDVDRMQILDETETEIIAYNRPIYGLTNLDFKIHFQENSQKFLQCGARFENPWIIYANGKATLRVYGKLDTSAKVIDSDVEFVNLLDAKLAATLALKLSDRSEKTSLELIFFDESLRPELKLVVLFASNVIYNWKRFKADPEGGRKETESGRRSICWCFP